MSQRTRKSHWAEVYATAYSHRVYPTRNMCRDAGGDDHLFEGGGGLGTSRRPEGWREEESAILDMRIPPFPITPDVSKCPTSHGEAPQGRGRGKESTGGERQWPVQRERKRPKQPSRRSRGGGGVSGRHGGTWGDDRCMFRPLTHLLPEFANEAF